MGKSLFYMFNRRKFVAKMADNPLITAGIFFVVYFILGFLWFFASDFVFDTRLDDALPADRYFMKDLVFVLLNAGLLFIATLSGLWLLKSARDAVEKEISEKNRALRSAESEFSDLTRKVSHDLKAPIRSVLGFSEALKEDYIEDLDPAAIEYLARIRKSAERMSDLINGLVDYVKTASIEPRFEPVDIVKFMETKVLNGVNLRLENPVTVVTSGPVPAIHADKNLLGRVLGEVLINAGLYVHKDVNPLVVITGKQYEDCNEIVIRDNGIGVDPVQQENIFAVFTRLHGVEAYPGLGIGLAIAKRSMLRMSGNIELRSDGKNGSEIVLSFQKHY